MVGDADLGYESSRTDFGTLPALRLDESYRRAHLPLVAPTHADVIAADADKGYQMGRHEPRHALVLPVDAGALECSPAYEQLLDTLKNCGFSTKIAWDLLPRRASMLHATLCGGLPAQGLSADAIEAIGTQPAFEVELRGLFSGNINTGRLYLKLYPQRRAGRNCIATLQQAAGGRDTRLYLAGLFNLTDHLDAEETRQLKHVIDTWWDRPILRLTMREVWVIGAQDDLVLDSRIIQMIRLKS